MKEIFNPFVIPFVLGMVFVLSYCVIGLIRVVSQLSKSDRRKFLLSLVTPRTVALNLRDLFNDCLFHVKIWRRKPILGYMHSSIAFGWFMIILIGHVELFTLHPLQNVQIPEYNLIATNFYFPIFYKYFNPVEPTLYAKVLSFLMDFFLLVILSGIIMAIIKKLRSRALGVRRIMRFGFVDNVVRGSLWMIFILRFLAEKTQLIGFWWAYSIDLCIFMCMLPFTRYMHIPTEALFILMRHAGLRVRHPRKGYALAQLYSCPSCGLCIDACPMSVNNTNSRNTSAYFVKNLRDKNYDEAKEIAEACLMCGKCVSICPVSIDTCDMKMGQRATIPYNVKSNFDYLDNLVVPIEKETKVLYFAGCMTQLTPKIMRSMVKIMQAAGEDYEILDKDGSVCCGRPMLLSGKTAEARALILKNTELIKKSGAKKLVLSCPICYKVFKEEYHLKGIKIQHHTQYINELVKNGKIETNNSVLKYVYHDPCELGRSFRIYDEPREVIQSVGLLVSAKSEKEVSVCCGGSLGSINLSQQERDEITKNSVADLMYNNPEKIVTSCPLCLKTFARNAPVEVLDIAEVVASRLK